MNGDADKDGLPQALNSMIALESQLETTLALVSAETKGYLEAPTIIRQLQSLATAQREALRAHLQGLSVTDIPLAPSAISAAFAPPVESQRGEQVQGTLAVLRAVATAFTRAAFGYAVLHAFAHRSSEIGTADLADQHRRNYFKAVQAIHQAVGDVAVQEMQEAGLTCRCQCPACGPGICICWHVHVHPDVTGPGAPTEGIAVRAPRAQSNAERAGLRQGDVILAVDGQEVWSYEDLRDGMGAHEQGEDVRLLVQRETGDPQEMVVTR